jgi:prepilin-type N-terminal cleavage/methylation domain-containing protein
MTRPQGELREHPASDTRGARHPQREPAPTSGLRRGLRRGFTLLEVMLAVGLSAVVIYLIAGAIDFHLRQLTVRKTRIEEAQLARAILQRMADDLRAVVVDRPVDFSSVGQLASALAPGGSGQSDGGSGGDEAPTDGSSPASDLVDSSLLPATPGVYGNTYELQVDISRIPRYEEYALVQESADPAMLQSLSDVKTVSYLMLGQPGMTGAPLARSNASSYTSNLTNTRSLGLPPDQLWQGLGRRVLDRAATRFAMNNADYSFLEAQTELFAPEVLLVQFRYFDGLQWLTEWDTEQYGGIPLAVELVLVLQANDATSSDLSLNERSASQQDVLGQFDPEHVYRLVVQLPAAEPIDTTSLSTSSTETTNEGGSP